MKTPKIFILISIFFIFSQNVSFSQYSDNWLEKKDPIQYRKLYLHTDRESYFQGDSIWFKAYYLDGQTQKFISGIYSMYTVLIDNNGKSIYRQVVPITDGIAAGQLTIPDTLQPGDCLLRAYTDFQERIGEEAFFHKKIKISTYKISISQMEDNLIKKQSEIDVEFLPEGGFLLTGQQNIVGIKAIDKNGEGISVQGIILNSHGEVISQFATAHKGMGIVKINPQAGEKYSARIENYPDFEFGDISQEGIKIEFVGETKDDLFFRSTTNSTLFQGKHYYFAIMHRGKVIFYQEFIQEDKSFPIKVKRPALPAGINRFVLLDEALKPVSERLYFSKNYKVNDVQIELDQEVYATRSNIQMDIFDEEWTGDDSFSSLSIAVVDEIAIGENGPELNLISWLLIDSELKGIIESPAQYFTDYEAITSEDKLNLLMLTQGWSKYIWNAIPEKNIATDQKEVEGISITGKVQHSLTKKPISSGKVSLRIFNNEFYINENVKTNKNGRFSFDNIFFTDTASVFLQAKNKRDKLFTLISFDSIFNEIPIVSKLYLPTNSIQPDFHSKLQKQQYDNKLAMRDYILESGAILLDEVNIYGQKPKIEDRHYRVYNKPQASLIVTNRDLTNRNVIDYLQGRVAGVRVVGDNIRIHGPGSFADSTPLFLLDGMEVSKDVVLSIPMNDIDVIEVLKGNEAAIFGTRAANGAISIFTKLEAGKGNFHNYAPGTITSKIVGYSSYREFYTPRYTPENVASEKPDHRLTLYWNPNVITEAGKATVSFFTSDDISRYMVFVEGITSDGKICLGFAEMIVNMNQIGQEKQQIK